MCSLGFTNGIHCSCSAAIGSSCKNTQRQTYMQNVSLACEQATSDSKPPKTKPQQTKPKPQITPGVCQIARASTHWSRPVEVKNSLLRQILNYTGLHAKQRYGVWAQLSRPIPVLQTLHRTKESSKSRTPEYHIDFQALLSPERWKEGLSVEHSIICYQSLTETLTSNVDIKIFWTRCEHLCRKTWILYSVTHKIQDKSPAGKSQPLVIKGKLRLNTTLFPQNDGSVL